MLLIAVAPMPAGYYNILRWVIWLAASNIGSIGISWRKHGTWWVAIVFGCVDILFNPITPAELPRTVWIVTDLLVSALFGYTAFAVEKPLDETYKIDIYLIAGRLFLGVLFTVLVICGLRILQGILNDFFTIFPYPK
jgi:hypothetical protein